MQKLVGSTVVNYISAGEGNKKTALFLHGWGRNAHDWDNLTRELVKKYHCISLDLPGFGATISDFSKAWSVEDYAKLVEGFIQKTDTKPDVIVAHSFGGKIAVKIANNYKISRLILISPSVAFSSNSFTEAKKILFKILKFPALLLGNNIKTKLARFLSSSDYKNAGELLPTFKNTVNRKLIEEARQITQNTLIIWGDKDDQLSVSNAKTLKGLIKNSKVRIVWGAGHDPHLTHTNKLLAILKEEGIWEY